ncbi:hypothetical protein [Kamptonema formosum]|uniref:hypothetical protein n=1 Tax=Kamptonema formosum TaxID=331992 RepID=UPI0012DD03E1|nr:hypothetical protein [Oscillatoria sp. PCC 10802]
MPADRKLAAPVVGRAPQRVAFLDPSAAHRWGSPSQWGFCVAGAGEKAGDRSNPKVPALPHRRNACADPARLQALASPAIRPGGEVLSLQRPGQSPADLAKYRKPWNAAPSIHHQQT